MRAFGVVVTEEERDRKVAFFVRVEFAGVEALALDRPIESFDAAVGPGVIGPSVAVAQATPGEVFAEAAQVAIPVVSEHALHANAPAVEEGHCGIDEGDRVVGSVGLAQLGEREPAGEVDRHVQVTPTDFPQRPGLAVMHQPATPAAAAQPADALGVDGHQLARLGDLEVTEPPRRLGEQVGQSVRLVPAQDPVRRAHRQAEDRADAVRPPALLDPHGEHRCLAGVAGPLGRAVRPAWPILKVWCATQPAIHGASTHPQLSRGAGHAEANCLLHEECAHPRGGRGRVIQRTALRLVVFGFDTSHPSRGLSFVTQVAGDLN